MASKRRNSSSVSSRSPTPVATSKIVEGCLAINKPTGISSAQVLRDMQTQFDPSALFEPWLAREKAIRERENNNQRGRRTKKRDMRVKIGHGGTLDPLATGVLIAGIGNGTKDLKGFLDCTKSYECVVLFGAATDTYDSVGKIVGRAAFTHITKERVSEALQSFRGKIMQRPPLYSALHVQGKRLYEYAREGLEVPVEIAERPVEVEVLEMVEWMEGGTHRYQWPNKEATENENIVTEKLLSLDGSGRDTSKAHALEHDHSEAKRKRSESPVSAANKTPDGKRKRVPEDETVMSAVLSRNPVKTGDVSVSDSNVYGPPAARLRMTVTSGFYVRSLCQDLGVAVGSLGLMSELVRTRQASFELGKNVLEYNDLEKGEEVWGPKVEVMLNNWYHGSSAHPARG